MENSMTITKSRNDAKLILKNMPKELQAACDKIFVAGADFGGAIVNMNEHDSAFRLALLEASNTYGKPKDSKYKGFGEFACAVFGFTSAPAVTNAVKVAAHIDAEKVPKLSSWYSTGMLYELRGVPADVLKTDVESGKLRPGMTQQELREYNAANKLEDGKAKVVKLYDGEYYAVRLHPDETAQVMHDTFKGLSQDEICGLLDFVERQHDGTHFTAFNPHAELTRTTKKGTTTVNGKGIFFHSLEGVAWAKYFPAETSKSNGPTAETVNAQNATIEKMRAAMRAAGLDPDAI